ncbi:MAG: hypothetical protein ACE5EM_05555 [Sphingomonadales bacterium]
MKVELTTTGMVGCFANSGKMWEDEYSCLYDFLLSESSDDLKKALSAFNDAWEDYREKLLAAYWVQAHEKGGTTW